MINEFMAFNQDFLEDEDGNHPDWIELYNSDSAAYDLEGHFLTDDPDNLDKWMFPAVSIPSGGHLLVFASEKDRRDARGELHTNFRLDGDGDQLLLITPDGSTILSGFFPSFPPQVRTRPTASRPTAPSSSWSEAMPPTAFSYPLTTRSNPRG